MPPDPVDLIRRMAGGDRHAFGAFYDTFAPLAFGLIRRIVRNAAEAEDVLQEVFLELWASAHTFDPARGTPEAWIVMRARSRGIDRIRSIRRKNEGMAELSGATVPDAVPDPASRAEGRELVRGALARLTPNQQEVIELAFFEGLTQSEIAARVGQPLGTVKTRMRLGLEKLRELIGQPR
jgi:RNA polymerase sigma-70 factor (ECF subfamily)